MKHFILILASVLPVIHTDAQNFDIPDFNKKAALAEWLYEYDAIAWWTSDSVMKGDQAEIAQLGAEWFCLRDDAKNWHAYYGKDQEGVFHTVFHYVVDSAYNVRRSFEETDSTILNPYSRALVNTATQMEPLRDSITIRFNQYLYENQDGEIEVWVFPAFQPDGTAVYGGEFHFVFDASGHHLLSKDEYFQGNFRGFQVGEPREIWLNYRDTDKPTVGAVFFAWYYKKYFTEINIDTRTSTSKPVESNGSYSWIHVTKEVERKRKKRRRNND